MTDFDNSLVMVTGATGGFGVHFVEQLLAAGARLAVTDRDPGALDELVDRHAEAEARFEAVITADLSSLPGCRDLHSAMSSRGLIPDIMINNAGIAVAGRLDHVPSARWETLMQLDLLAPMRLCEAFLPAMVERGSGHIVNISSLAGWIGSPGLTSYCAAKFGLRGFGEALALDVEDHGLRVSTAYPSFSDTPILDSEQYGFDEPREVPRDLLTDPAAVVERIIDGVRRDRLEIFPDRTSLAMHYIARYVPALIPVLQRRLDRKTREAARG